MCQQKVVTESVFGKEIDESCPGYTWFGKLFVFLGIMANEIDNHHYAKVDEDLEMEEEQKKKRPQ